MALKEYPPPGYRYVLDIDKLYKAFEGKRKQDKLSRDRIAARYGLSKNSFTYQKGKTSLDAKVLIPMLKYLDKPYEDFVKTVEVNSNGSKEGRTSEAGSKSKKDRLDS